MYWKSYLHPLYTIEPLKICDFSKLQALHKSNMHEPWRIIYFFGLENAYSISMHKALIRF